jgi:hypothetical protein
MYECIETSSWPWNLRHVLACRSLYLWLLYTARLSRWQKQSRQLVHSQLCLIHLGPTK